MRFRLATVCLCLAGTGLQAQEASAQDVAEAQPREWLGGAPPWQWTRATGDWFGLRNTLEDAGVGGGRNVWKRQADVDQENDAEQLYRLK